MASTTPPASPILLNTAAATSAVLRDAAVHRAQLEDAIANIAGTINTADKIYETDPHRWTIDWDDLASIGSEVRVGSRNREDNVKFDQNIFGPQLKQTTKDGQAAEIQQVLLAKDRDFTDALINIDRDNFLANPQDSILHDVQLLRTVSAGVYAVNRGLFMGMSSDNAMTNVHYYRFMIRHIRSQLYLANLISENVERMADRTFNLEVIKEKYEATIFTLRRQLDDYHKAHGAVGKDISGKVVANESTGRSVLQSMMNAAANANATLDAVNNVGVGGGAAAAVLAGYTGGDNTAAFVVVQIEDLGNLRTRQRALMEKALEHCKQVMLNTANGYDAKRTNYHEENERKDSHNLPSCFMFRVPDTHNAVAFALELHVELANNPEWPKQLMEMKRFCGAEGDPNGKLWKGLRARIGLHFGEASIVESPEGTVVQHYEGVTIDKAMRLASMATCGESIVSRTAWETYQQELREGKVPPSKRYQSLRTMLSDKVDSGRKRGFKKDEYYMRLWAQSLEGRKDSKPADVDVEFGLISFFGLEIAANIVEEAESITAEDMLQAKDTEITLLQQELDTLRLAILKRDSDMEDIRTQMFSHISQLGAQMNAKTFYHEQLASSLESELMRAHDTIARCSHITASQALGRVRGVMSPLSPNLQGLVSNHPDGGGGESAQPPPALSPYAGSPMSVPDLVVSVYNDAAEEMSLDELDKKRMRHFDEWQREGGDTSGGGGRASRRASHVGGDLKRTKSTLSDTNSGQNRKHKNHKLWRELNSLITGATVMSKAPPKSRMARVGGHPAANGNAAGGVAITEPSVTQKIHSLVRVYGQLLKRFSNLNNTAAGGGGGAGGAAAKMAADVDDQTLTEDQFIQLFLKLTNSDTVGSARDTFQLCMQTAIEAPDVEMANGGDDGRLVKSVIGHFVKIFMLFRTMKKKALFEANVLDEEAAAKEAADRIAAAANAPIKKGGVAKKKTAAGGGPRTSLSTPSATPASGSLLGGGGTPAKPPSSPSPAALSANATVAFVKQIEALEKNNAALVRDVANRNDRLEDAKARTAIHEETIKALRDELRRVKNEGEQRVKAAVIQAAQQHQQQQANGGVGNNTLTPSGGGGGNNTNSGAVGRRNSNTSLVRRSSFSSGVGANTATEGTAMEGSGSSQAAMANSNRTDNPTTTSAKAAVINNKGGSGGAANTTTTNSTTNTRVMSSRKQSATLVGVPAADGDDRQEGSLRSGKLTGRINKQRVASGSGRAGTANSAASGSRGSLHGGGDNDADGVVGGGNANGNGTPVSPTDIDMSPSARTNENSFVSRRSNNRNEASGLDVNTDDDDDEEEEEVYYQQDEDDREVVGGSSTMRGRPHRAIVSQDASFRSNVGSSGVAHQSPKAPARRAPRREYGIGGGDDAPSSSSSPTASPRRPTYKRVGPPRTHLELLLDCYLLDNSQQNESNGAATNIGGGPLAVAAFNNGAAGPLLCGRCGGNAAANMGGGPSNNATTNSVASPRPAMVIKSAGALAPAGVTPPSHQLPPPGVVGIAPNPLVSRAMPHQQQQQGVAHPPTNTSNSNQHQSSYDTTTAYCMASDAASPRELNATGNGSMYSGIVGDGDDHKANDDHQQDAGGAHQQIPADGTTAQPSSVSGAGVRQQAATPYTAQPAALGLAHAVRAATADKAHHNNSGPLAVFGSSTNMNSSMRGTTSPKGSPRDSPRGGGNGAYANFVADGQDNGWMVSGASGGGGGNTATAPSKVGPAVNAAPRFNALIHNQSQQLLQQQQQMARDHQQHAMRLINEQQQQGGSDANSDAYKKALQQQVHASDGIRVAKNGSTTAQLAWNLQQQEGSFMGGVGHPTPASSQGRRAHHLYGFRDHKNYGTDTQHNGVDFTNAAVLGHALLPSTTSPTNNALARVGDGGVVHASLTPVRGGRSGGGGGGSRRGSYITDDDHDPTTDSGGDPIVESFGIGPNNNRHASAALPPVIIGGKSVTIPSNLNPNAGTASPAKVSMREITADSLFPSASSGGGGVVGVGLGGANSNTGGGVGPTGGYVTSPNRHLITLQSLKRHSTSGQPTNPHRSPPSTHLMGAMTPPPGGLSPNDDGSSLRFALTRAENEAVLAKAAEEREQYYAEQRRLQEQLLELRALQQQSAALMGGRPKGIPLSVHQKDVAYHAPDGMMTTALGGSGSGGALGAGIGINDGGNAATIAITRILPQPKGVAPINANIGTTTGVGGGSRIGGIPVSRSRAQTPTTAGATTSTLTSPVKGTTAPNATTPTTGLVGRVRSHTSKEKAAAAAKAKVVSGTVTPNNNNKGTPSTTPLPEGAVGDP